jgi:hypothetical protein
MTDPTDPDAWAARHVVRSVQPTHDTPEAVLDWPSTGHYTRMGQRCSHVRLVLEWPGGPTRPARCGNVTLDPSGLCYLHRVQS